MNEDKSIIETAQRYLDRTDGNSWEAVVNRYIDRIGNNEHVSAINENERKRIRREKKKTRNIIQTRKEPDKLN